MPLRPAPLSLYIARVYNGDVFDASLKKITRWAKALFGTLLFQSRVLLVGAFVPWCLILKLRQNIKQQISTKLHHVQTFQEGYGPLLLLVYIFQKLLAILHHLAAASRQVTHKAGQGSGLGEAA